MKKFERRNLLIILSVIISLLIISLIVTRFIPKRPQLTHRYLPGFLPPNVLPATMKKFPNSFTYSCNKGGLFGVSQRYPIIRICEYEISKCHEYTDREYYEVEKESFVSNHAKILYTKAQGNDAYIVENYEDDTINLSYQAYFPLNDSVVEINTSGQCLGVNEIPNKIERENKAVEILTKVGNSLFINSR